MTKGEKNALKIIFLLLCAIVAFFLFDSLFNQYNYTQDFWIADQKIVRYTLLVSIIIEAIILYTKHPERRLIGNILLWSNIAVIYYSTFVQNSLYPQQWLYTIGPITLIFLMLSAYKLRRGLIVSTILIGLLIIHMLMVLPGYDQEIQLQDFKQAQQNTATRHKQSDIQDQIISIYNEETNLKQTINPQQSEQAYKLEITPNTVITYGSSRESEVDTLELQLRDSSIMTIKPQSAIKFDTIPSKQDNEQKSYFLSMREGELQRDALQKGQTVSIKTSQGTITLQPPMYIQHKQRTTTRTFKQGTGVIQDLSGAVWTVSPGSYAFPQTPIAEQSKNPYDESIITKAKDEYQKTRNKRRQDYITDRNKNPWTHNLIHTKLKLSTIVDSRFYIQLFERNKLACIIYDHNCLRVKEFADFAKSFPRPMY